MLPVQQKAEGTLSKPFQGLIKNWTCIPLCLAQEVTIQTFPKLHLCITGVSLGLNSVQWLCITITTIFMYITLGNPGVFGGIREL